MASELKTYQEAAVELGTTSMWISCLVFVLEIRPKKVARCPNGKGLDEADMALIRKALRQDQTMESMTA